MELTTMAIENVFKRTNTVIGGMRGLTAIGFNFHAEYNNENESIISFRKENCEVLFRYGSKGKGIELLTVNIK